MPGYGTPLSLTLPTINGIATEAQAAPLINTALAAIIARLESKVGAADLDINADLSFKSGSVYSGATNLHRTAYRNLTSAITAASNPSTVYVLNGDLHYIDASGNLVQITSGGQVNVSTTGGITGAGYGTGGVEVNYDSVNGQYRLRDGAGADDFADVVVADALFNDGSGNFIRLQAPALSADYTMTLPAAVPVSTSLLQMTSAGLVQTTTTPTLTGLTVNATATILGADITVNLNVGGDLTLTGDLKHGTRNRIVSAFGMSGGATLDLSSDGYREQDPGSGLITCDVPLIAGDRLLSVTVMSERSGAGNRDLSLRYVDQTTANVTTVQTVTSTSVGTGTVVYDFTNTTMLSNRGHYVQFDGENGDQVFSMLFTYDRP